MGKVLVKIVELKGDKAVVRLLEGCEKCPHKCSMATSASKQFEVENKGYKVGEIVLIDDPFTEGDLIKGYLLLFGVPMLGVILGAGATSYFFKEPVSGAILGLALGGLTLRLIDRAFKKS